MIQKPGFVKLLVITFIVSSTFVLAYSSFIAQTTDSVMRSNIARGEKLFQANCTGCHLNGQNLINPNKPIIGSPKLKTKKAFKAWLASPVPPMPSFKNITSKPAQLNALYSYVISLMGG